MKDRVVFKTGKFTDFSGKERVVTFCAISTEDIDMFDPYEAVKKVLLGVSVQNPRDDKNNDVLSKVVAEGKARKEKSRVATLYSDRKGVINHRVVEALLEQELEYFKQNPGVYIAGYNKDKELFKINPSEYFKKYGISNI